MSKYDPIYALLRGKSGPVEVSLASLSELVEGGLPASAYHHGAWWSSDDDTHVQSRSWSLAGYDAKPDLAARRVRFCSALSLQRLRRSTAYRRRKDATRTAIGTLVSGTQSSVSAAVVLSRSTAATSPAAARSPSCKSSRGASRYMNDGLEQPLNAKGLLRKQRRLRSRRVRGLYGVNEFEAIAGTLNEPGQVWFVYGGTEAD